MDSIYHRFAPKMQQAISREALMQAYDKQLKPMGTIVGFGFDEVTNNVTRYKITTSSGVLLQMLLALDSNQAITTFAFQPYQQKPEKERTNIYTDNALVSAMDSMVHTYAMDYLKNRFTPGMSIGILSGSKSYYYNYGISNSATEQHPTRHTQYEIGSITKTMVAFVLADAFATGKLQYQESIYKYLPDSVQTNKALANIKWIHLSNHTSGLPRLPDNLLKGSQNFNDTYAYYTVPVLFAALKQIKLDSEPGTTYSYSNLAVGLLGTLLENLYGESLPALFQRMIFNPAQMHDSYVAITGNATDTTLLATPHNAAGKRTVYWHFKALAGAGAVVSSTHDMLQYLARLTLRPLQKGKPDPRWQYIDSITYSGTERVSLAWHFNAADAKFKTMEHSGGTGGFRTHAVICQGIKSSVFVAINASEDPGATLVGGQLMQYLIRQNISNNKP